MSSLIVLLRLGADEQESLVPLRWLVKGFGEKLEVYSGIQVHLLKTFISIAQGLVAFSCASRRQPGVVFPLSLSCPTLSDLPK